MGMLSNTSNSNPFLATIQLSAGEIQDYVAAALAKRGYDSVKVSYEYRDNGASYDRFATATTTVLLSGNKDGKAETDRITIDQLRQLVADELRADGHSLKTDSYNPIGVNISYRESERSASGSAVLLIARKR